ncbi:hypothetical protein DTG61_11240 [Salmonella enterica subsp. enterica serovar Brunei]|nr:hypothetical protein [Salmonella enterica subsp. enterica serovar Brunei]ECD1418292.1 hypothetical protein [Salmonella enterica subsp. enterica serovar Brunei]EEC0275918.1 hypothetical protein [Salmonella enterica subsp. enterica]
MGVFLKTGPWHQSLSFLRKLPMYNILNFFVSGIQGLYMIHVITDYCTDIYCFLYFPWAKNFPSE